MPAATTNLIRLQTTQGGRSDPIDSCSKASYGYPGSGFHLRALSKAITLTLYRGKFNNAYYAYCYPNACSIGT